MSGPCLATDPTLNLAYDQNGLTATPIIDPASDNALRCQANGLAVSSYFGPVARYTNGAGQSIPNNALTGLTLDTTRYEGWAPTLRAGGLITAPVTGTYEVGFAVTWVATGAGWRAIQARNISPAAPVPICGDHIDALFCTAMSASGAVRLQQGEVVQVLAIQNSGAPVSISAGTGANYSLFDVWIALLEQG